MGKKILRVDTAAMKALINYNWRGGVRELENVIERAVIFSEDETIRLTNLTDYIRSDFNTHKFPDSLKDAIRNFEREHIASVIKNHNYSKEEAAKALSIGLSSLYRKIEELNIPSKPNDE